MLLSLQPEVSSLALGCSGDCCCCSSYQVVQSDSTYNENTDTVSDADWPRFRTRVAGLRAQTENPKLQTPVKE